MVSSLWPVIIQYGIPVVIGAVSGFGGGYFSWDIDKRRDLRARRRALIDEWRRDLVPIVSNDGNDVIGPGGHPINSAEAFRTLRPHLSQGLRVRLDGKAGKDIFSPVPITVHINSHGQLRRDLMDEIDALERRWKLV